MIWFETWPCINKYCFALGILKLTAQKCANSILKVVLAAQVKDISNFVRVMEDLLWQSSGPLRFEKHGKGQFIFFLRLPRFIRCEWRKSGVCAAGGATLCDAPTHFMRNEQRYKYSTGPKVLWAPF